MRLQTLHSDIILIYVRSCFSLFDVCFSCDLFIFLVENGMHLRGCQKYEKGFSLVGPEQVFFPYNTPEMSIRGLKMNMHQLYFSNNSLNLLLSYEILQFSPIILVLLVHPKVNSLIYSAIFKFYTALLMSLRFAIH